MAGSSKPFEYGTMDDEPFDDYDDLIDFDEDDARPPDGCCVAALKDLWTYWRSIAVVAIPLALLPLPVYAQNQQSYCAYILLVMAFFWMLEVLPLAVTAFLPVFLFPLFGVLDGDRISKNYLKDTTFLFFACLMIALGVQTSMLHRRIALRVLLFVGPHPRWIMFGFMIVTAFLSMWINNAATTAMMVPIAVAVLEQIIAPDDSISHRKGTVVLSQDGGRLPERHRLLMRQESEKNRGRLDTSTMPKSQARICKAVILSVCYAANIGGTATQTGCGPNLVLRGVLTTFYPGVDTGITYASWILFETPVMIVFLFISWLWLQLAYFGFRGLFDCFSRRRRYSDEDAENITHVIRQKYVAMGEVTFAELSVMFWFVILLLLWMLRDPKFMPGWSVLFKDGYVTDGTVAIMISCIFFWWPNEWPDFFCWRKDLHRKGHARRGLLTWGDMQEKFGWSVIMLLGGGFALADAITSSGLSDWLGCTLERVVEAAGASPFVVITVLSLMIAFISEMASNAAIASIFQPVLLSVAENLRVHPLYFALPGTIAASRAFMLPVATPCNLIIYNTRIVSIWDMVKMGFLMDVIGVFAGLLNTHTFGYWLWGVDTFPDWAVGHIGNRTAGCI